MVLPVRAAGLGRPLRKVLDDLEARANARPFPLFDDREAPLEGIVRRVHVALTAAFPDDLVAVVAKPRDAGTIVLLHDPDDRDPRATLDLAGELQTIDLTGPDGGGDRGPVPLVIDDRIGVRRDVDGHQRRASLFVLRRGGTLAAPDIAAIEAIASLTGEALRDR